jgi:hypothetical protein
LIVTALSIGSSSLKVKLGKNKRALISFFALRMLSEGNAPKNGEPTVGFYDNAPAHRSVLVKDFSAKKQCDNTGAYPYPHDVAEADFYLLPPLKSALTGRRFCDVTDITKDATEELKRLSQDGFQEYHQQLYSR